MKHGEIEGLKDEDILNLYKEALDTHIAGMYQCVKYCLYCSDTCDWTSGHVITCYTEAYGGGCSRYVGYYNARRGITWPCWHECGR